MSTTVGLPRIFTQNFPVTANAPCSSIAWWQSAPLVGFMLQKPETTSLCTAPTPQISNGRTSVSVKQIVCFSLHQRPRTSQSPPWLASQISPFRRPADLVLLHDGRQSGMQPLLHWRTHLPVDLICHVRTGNVNDIARLARFLRGTAITLVLSAGGARGFAHLGVVRALREAHVPIDLI